MLFVVLVVSEKPEVTLQLSNADEIHSTFNEVIAGKRKRIGNSEENSFKKHSLDKEHFIPYKPSDQLFEKE